MPLYFSIQPSTTSENFSDQPANFAIGKAAIYCVSGTDYKNNAGAGLSFLTNDICVATDGTVVILSEDGLVIWNRGDISLEMSLPFELSGTMVSITSTGLE